MIGAKRRESHGSEKRESESRRGKRRSTIARIDWSSRQGYTTSFPSPMHAVQEPAVSALLGYHSWFTAIAESS